MSFSRRIISCRPLHAIPLVSNPALRRGGDHYQLQTIRLVSNTALRRRGDHHDAPMKPPFARLKPATGTFELVPMSSKNVSSSQLMEFLMATNILYDRSDKSVEFSRILRPDEAPPSRLEYYLACRGRLDRLLANEGDVVSDTIPEGVQTFSDFSSLHPLWNDPLTSFIFHRDHPSIASKSNVLRQRAQLSGLCYIHGPDLLQHYLVEMKSEGAVGMIDISKLIRNSFSTRSLEKHIFDDEGGSSIDMLKTILHEGSVMASANRAYSDQLRDYGPGLVSAFNVHPEIADRSVFKHHGKSEEKSIGRHCMVMIGFSTDKTTGKSVYLLQNFWKKKQFVQVDEYYLEYSGALVHFVKTPQTHIPNTFAVDMEIYAENGQYVDDKGESSSKGEYYIQM